MAKPKKHVAQAISLRDLNLARVESFASEPPARDADRRGIALVTIDADLLTMIREARDVIVAHVPDYYDVPTWDRPWDLSWWDPAPSILTAGWHGRLREKAMELCHAIGFVAGCAATFDKTPCELLDLIT